MGYNFLIREGNACYVRFANPDEGRRLIVVVRVCRRLDSLKHFAHGAFMIAFLDEVLYFL